ncbi:MAG: thioredoxin family protein [Planctomycetaceae bacterium]|jgi:small redox-active disulfide protein 2|nr:thioredoxin family protein [Planctomycetaceae bacterium]
MQILVLGTNCDKCRKLYDNAAEAVKQLGIDADVRKVSEISEILTLGILLTPALLINGKTAVSGSSSSVEELKQLFANVPLA